MLLRHARLRSVPPVPGERKDPEREEGPGASPEAFCRFDLGRSLRSDPTAETEGQQSSHGRGGFLAVSSATSPSSRREAPLRLCLPAPCGAVRCDSVAGISKAATSCIVQGARRVHPALCGDRGRNGSDEFDAGVSTGLGELRIRSGDRPRSAGRRAARRSGRAARRSIVRVVRPRESVGDHVRRTIKSPPAPGTAPLVPDSRPYGSHPVPAVRASRVGTRQSSGTSRSREPRWYPIAAYMAVIWYQRDLAGATTDPEREKGPAGAGPFCSFDLRPKPPVRPNRRNGGPAVEPRSRRFPCGLLRDLPFESP